MRPYALRTLHPAPCPWALPWASLATDSLRAACHTCHPSLVRGRVAALEDVPSARCCCCCRHGVAGGAGGNGCGGVRSNCRLPGRESLHVLSSTEPSETGNKKGRGPRGHSGAPPALGHAPPRVSGVPSLAERERRASPRNNAPRLGLLASRYPNPLCHAVIGCVM